MRPPRLLRAALLAAGPSCIRNLLAQELSQPPSPTLPSLRSQARRPRPHQCRPCRLGTSPAAAPPRSQRVSRQARAHEDCRCRLPSPLLALAPPLPLPSPRYSPLHSPSPSPSPSALPSLPPSLRPCFRLASGRQAQTRCRRLPCPIHAVTKPIRRVPAGACSLAAGGSSACCPFSSLLRGKADAEAAELTLGRCTMGGLYPIVCFCV